MNISPPMRLIIYASIFLIAGVLYYTSHTEKDLKHISTHVSAQTAEEIVEYAREHLPHAGVLKEGPDGFVYVKVDDDYIYHLFPMLRTHAYVKPEYFRRPDAAGAHISVFYSDERSKTGKLEELDHTYSFTITGLTIVPPKTEEFIVLEVTSPELEQLRKKYGLSPLLKEHPFHITIAKKNHHYHPHHHMQHHAHSYYKKHL